MLKSKYCTTKQANKEWHKNSDAYSDAIDSFDKRKEIDAEIATLTNQTNITKTEMESFTPEFVVKTEDAESGYNEIKDINFGISERPRQEIALSKEVQDIKVTLANGLVIVDMKKEGNEFVGTKNHVMTLGPSAGKPNGAIWLEIDSELLQSAVLEVEYAIKVTNNSEKDYNYNSDNFYFYKYGKTNINSKIITITPTVVDYLDENWAFESGQNWKVNGLDITKELLEDNVYNNKNSTISKKKILLSENNSPIEPEKDSILNLKVSRILTVVDQIILDNEAEIIQISRPGGSIIHSVILGNYVPVTGGTEEISLIVDEEDDDMSETIMVTPPTGANKSNIMPIVAVSILSVLALGIILIKKKTKNI